MARTNKREKQIEDKKSHSKFLKVKKIEIELGQLLEPSIERRDPTIEQKRTFLIICEGKNTEPSYFNAFKVKTAQIKALGEGYNTISLVERTISIVKEELSKGVSYDEIWCVFDKDDFSDKDFNKAILIAHNNGFKTAYSNQSFEYWLFLHFNDHQGGKLDRKQCCQKLNQNLKQFDVNYPAETNKIINNKLFDLMMLKHENTNNKSRVDIAIERAKRIDNNLNNNNPAIEESSTKVYLLVQKLIKYL